MHINLHTNFFYLLFGCCFKSCKGQVFFFPHNSHISACRIKRTKCLGGYNRDFALVSAQDEKIILPGTEQILRPERTPRKRHKGEFSFEVLMFCFVFSLEWCKHNLRVLRTEDFDRTFAKTISLKAHLCSPCLQKTPVGGSDVYCSSTVGAGRRAPRKLGLDA